MSAATVGRCWLAAGLVIQWGCCCERSVGRKRRGDPGLRRLILLLTPTGSMPSQQWRWWARAAAVMPVAGLVSGPFRVSGGAVANPLAVAALSGPLLVVRIDLQAFIKLADADRYRAFRVALEVAMEQAR